jgi:hypothetical protein
MGNWKAEREHFPATHKKPAFIDGCKAWDSHGPVVQKLFPMFYRKSG